MSTAPVMAQAKRTNDIVFIMYYRLARIYTLLDS